jgi:SAM-dependent methyltransferase
MSGEPNLQLVCPLCGADSKLRFTVPTSPIRTCLAPDCGLVFAERQPTEQELNAYYTQLYYPKHSAETPIKRQSDQAKLRQHLGAIARRVDLSGLRVLDVGCGMGNLLEVASSMGAREAVGLEINDEARSLARSRGYEVVASLGELAGRAFDLIYMNDVIEHLRQPWAYCHGLHELLADEGHFFAVTGDVDGLKSRLLGKHWDIMQDPTHLYFFSQQSLTRTLQWAGYRNTETLRFPVDFSHHGFARRLLQRVLVRSGLDSSLKVIASK